MHTIYLGVHPYVRIQTAEETPLSLLSWPSTASIPQLGWDFMSLFPAHTGMLAGLIFACLVLTIAAVGSPWVRWLCHVQKTSFQSILLPSLILRLSLFPLLQLTSFSPLAWSLAAHFIHMDSHRLSSSRSWVSSTWRQEPITSQDCTRDACVNPHVNRWDTFLSLFELRA